MQQPVYATIGSGIVNTAFTVVSVSPAFGQQPGSRSGHHDRMTACPGSQACVNELELVRLITHTIQLTQTPR